MEKNEILNCLDFFNKLKISVEDVTTEVERNQNQLCVIATYKFENKEYRTERLFYKNILYQRNVKKAEFINSFFNEPVYWLDIDEHDWPEGDGAKLDKLVLDEIAGVSNIEFREFLSRTANDNKNGYEQRITADGRSARYGINLENNNHWHDIILLIQAIIKSNGKEVDKNYFNKLVFEWDNEQRTSLHPAFGSRAIIHSLYKNIQSIQFELKMENNINLLKYKKQIILQGPPGTGKTRKAKEIARELLLPKEITVNEIKAHIKIGSNIYSATDKIKYTVENISEINVTLLLQTGGKQTPSFQKIIEAYKTQKWNGGMTGGDAYEAAIAKHIFENIMPKEQFKLIQFHPSYSYEDFVRGIAAKPSDNGEGIMYEAENKLLGKFASDAYKNFTESSYKKSEIAETSFEQKLEKFIENINVELDKSGSSKIADDTNARIVGVVNDGLIYSFKTREEIKYKLLFSDLIKINNSPKPINKPSDLKIIERGYLEMYGKYPYYFKVYNLIKQITLDEYDIDRKISTLKNYVLIIDEINRANLSSVLGELIYALEYRGVEVESMYAVKGNNKLVLPPNLYIIGTMNTADRSVGNIDYAIRRRFAFVDVPPEDLSATLKDKFDKGLFDKVTALFNHDTYLSKEFEVKDVQLGHSYFIDKTDEGATMQMRLDYEIKPILREYVKDGVLIGEGIKKTIEDLS